MKMTLKAVALCAVLLSGSALAAKVDSFTPDAAWLQRAAPLLHNLKQPKFFRAPGGLIGIVGDLKGLPTILYTDNSASFLIFGQFVDLEKRRNLTADALATFAPESALGKLGSRLSDEMSASARAADKNIEAMQAKTKSLQDRISLSELSRLPGVDMGSGRRTLYAFIEPQCVACQTAVREISTWMDLPTNTGKMRVRWIPFSFGSPASTQTAAAILGSNSLPLIKRLGSGQQVSDTAQAAKGAFKLETITAYVEKTGIKSSPVFVFESGSTLRVFDGYPGINIIMGLK